MDRSRFLRRGIIRYLQSEYNDFGISFARVGVDTRAVDVAINYNKTIEVYRIVVMPQNKKVKD